MLSPLRVHVISDVICKAHDILQFFFRFICMYVDMLHSLVILFYFMIVFPLILQKTSSYHLHISHSKYSHHIYLLITHIFSYMAPEEIFSTWHIFKIFVFLICISSPFYDYSCTFFDVYIHKLLNCIFDWYQPWFYIPYTFVLFCFFINHIRNLVYVYY